MKYIAAAIALGIASTLNPAWAQTSGHNHGTLAQAAGAQPAATKNAGPMADGEIRRIDVEGRKLTIRHGEIKNLDMPAMTMVFQVADPALLNQVKVGDKIRFAAEKSGSSYAVTAIEPAR